MCDIAHALPGCLDYDCCIHESLSNPPNESNPVNGFKDANWFALEQSAKSGNVVPIIGSDALMIEYAGKTLPFYRLIAAELLASFQLDPDRKIVEQTWCLHHAVSEILRHAPVWSNASVVKSGYWSTSTAMPYNLLKAYVYWPISDLYAVYQLDAG